MPKPLAQEPDVQPVHEQVSELVRQAYTDRMAPIGIIFSAEGYARAQGQSVPGMHAFTGGQGQHHVATHYLGLPFTVDQHTDAQPDVRLELAPGGSAEAKAFRSNQRGGATTLEAVGRRQGGARFTVKDPMDRPTVELLAEGLTRPQICDLVSAWADANPNTDLSVAFRDAVRQYGRFE